MYVVSDAFRNKEYSGESEFKGRLVIGNTTVPNEQLSKITIEDYIIDSSSSENNGVFYIGTFIAQKVIIKFKNLDGIELHSGDDASLFISQYVGNEWVEIPMGVYQVDELAENYHETCEINLLDYSTKFRKNIDYSPCFVDGKATIDTILQYVCSSCGVTLGTYPTINGNEEIGQFDSEVSGKRWISYIAELKGSNAKIGRDGHLYLIPLKHEHTVSINALESASWKLGEKYEISRVRFDNGVILYEKGNETNNTLFLRQDNPFILSQEAVDNIYESLLTSGEEETEEGTSIDLDLVDDVNVGTFTLYGNTTQETTSGINLIPNNKTTATDKGVNFIALEDGTYYVNGTNDGTGNSAKYIFRDNINLPAGTYHGIPTGVNGLGIVAYVKYTDDTRQYIGIANKNVTISKDVKYADIYLQVSNGTATTFSNKRIYPILATTSIEESDYEPYTNGASPNPNYSQPINVATGGNTINICGKNLFSGFTKGYGLNSTNGTLIYDYAGGAISEFIPVDFNKHSSYYISGLTDTISSFIAGYDEKGLFIGRTTGTPREFMEINPSVMGGGTKQGIGDIKYIVVYQYKVTGQTGTIDDIDNLNVMLNEGATPIPYEAYTGQKYEIDLGKNLFDESVLNSYKVSEDDECYIFNTPTLYNQDLTSNITFEENTAYTIQYIAKQTTGNPRLRIIYTDNTYDDIPSFSIATTLTKYQKVSNANKTILKITGSYGSNVSNAFYIKKNSVQLEKGFIETSYATHKTPIELCKIENYQDSIFKSSGDNLWNTENQQLNKLTYDSSTGLYSATDNDNRSSLIYKIQQYNNNSAISGTATSVTISATGKYVLTTTIVENCNRIRFANNGQSYEFSLFINDIESLGINVGDTITLGFNVIDKTIGASKFNEVMLVKGSVTTPIYEPFGTDWYIKKEIGKVVLDGSEDYTTWGSSTTNTNGFKLSSVSNIIINSNSYNKGFLICNYFKEDTNNALYANDNNGIATLSGNLYFRIEKTLANSVTNFKTWLSTHNTSVYYRLNTPTYIKIEGELEEQLETLKDIVLYKGINHINQNNNYLPFNLQLDYASSTQFEMYSLKTRNYGDISLDAWDLIDYQLGSDTYTTYNNRKLTFEMSIMSDTNVQISNKQQEETTNLIGGSQATQTRKLKTTVNALDNKITLEAEQINTNLNSQEGRISSLEISANGLSTTVSSLQTYTNEELEKINTDFNNYKTLNDDEIEQINSKFDGYATKSDLITIENSVNTITTDTYTKTEINTFLTDGSVKKIQTTSLTADENGLSFDKTNAPTTSNINEKGVTVKDRNNNPILRAVYDDTIENSIVETYRHQVHEYFIMGEHSRFEDYEDGTGCFYID